ncbi:MAG: hypothetical protein AAF703_11690 [Cyanobacteria bacterium P01_D01_bin.105]
MPALLPMFAIVAVFLFISTHAAVTSSKKDKTTEPSELEKAAKELAKALNKPTAEKKK